MSSFWMPCLVSGHPPAKNPKLQFRVQHMYDSCINVFTIDIFNKQLWVHTLHFCRSFYYFLRVFGMWKQESPFPAIIALLVAAEVPSPLWARPYTFHGINFGVGPDHPENTWERLPMWCIEICMLKLTNVFFPRKSCT